MVTVAAPLLGLLGLTLGVAALIWRRSPHLGHAALAAAGLSQVALVVHFVGLDLVFLTLVVDGLALTLVTWRFRWRATAHVVGVHAFIALVVGIVSWILQRSPKLTPLLLT
jgi:hypothetical protein